MRISLKRSIAILAMLTLAIAQGPALLFAQTTTGAGNGFKIFRVRHETTIEKGKSETVAIGVENPTGETIIARPVVNDFVSSDKEDGEPRLILDENAPAPKNSFKELISPMTDVQLGPREKKDISVTINVPADANSGGYYGAVRMVPTAVPGAGNVGLTASVGTIFLVRVPGDLTERLDLVQLSAAQKTGQEGENAYKARSFFTSGDVAVLTRLKNSGDIHLQPFGRVQIRNTFGKVVHEYEFNNSDAQVNSRSNILPDATRRFTDDVNGKKWFGRYTIESNLGYSQGGGELVTSKATFWYIPALALYVIIALVLAAVGFVYWMIRKTKAKRQHKHDVNKRKI